MGRIKPNIRVFIIGDHPWSGHAGIVEEKMDTLIGPMWRVNLDNGIAAGCRKENLKEAGDGGD